MNNDRFRTIAQEGQSLLREKASRFIGTAFPLRDEAEFKLRLRSLQKEHHSAKHFCFAWVLGDEAEQHRANDAGEPTGTAGKPILNRIRSLDLTYCGVVVIRYFGGTLLGTAGLVKAYGGAAQQALDATTVIERTAVVHVRIACAYAQLEMVRNPVRSCGGEVHRIAYAENLSIEASIPKSLVNEQIGTWRAQGMDARPVDHVK